MVPNIKKGSSFRGAMLYYLHDKKREAEHLRLSDDRVAWMTTRNCAASDPGLAFKEMAATAWDAERLKAAAGERLAGRPLEEPVMTISLSWHPNERPGAEEMEKAADDYLRFMGWNEHQAVYIAHNDTGHAHVHIVLNRVHPETGKVLDDAFSKNRSQMWARDYEREHGRIWCQEREGKDYTRADDGPSRGLPHHEAIEAREAARRYVALEAAAMTLDAREKELLSRRHQEEREAFLEARHTQFRQARQAAYREVREAYRERWAEHFREADQMRREADREQRGLASRVLHLAREGQFAAAWCALSDRDPIGMATGKQIAKQGRALREAQRGETRARQDAACKELFEERRLTFAATKQRQKEERAELKELQAGRAQQRPYDRERLIRLLDERPPQPDRNLHERHIHERTAFMKETAQAMRELRSAIRDEVRAEFAGEWKAHADHRDERKLKARIYDRAARRTRRRYRRHGPLHGVEAVHQIRTRQQDYHHRMRKELREQQRAIAAGMRERNAALIEPALARLSEDRANAYAQLLARQQHERPGLGHDRQHGHAPHDLTAHAIGHPNRVLTLEQIMAYKAHAISAVLRGQQLEQARREVTGQARGDNNGHADQPTREREKTAQERFDEYFAQHGAQLRREEAQRQQQKSRDRGR
jgi:hypothetical protein